MTDKYQKILTLLDELKNEILKLSKEEVLEPSTVQVTPSAPKHTIDEIRGLAAKIMSSNPDAGKEIKAILAKFGAEKLSAIQAENIDAVYEEVSCIVLF